MAETQEQAFDRVKDIISRASLLMFCEPVEQLQLHCDAAGDLTSSSDTKPEDQSIC